MIAGAGMCLVLRRDSRFSEALSIGCATCFILSFCRSEFDTLVFLGGSAALFAMALEARRPSAEDHGWPWPSLAAVVVVLSGCMMYIRHVALGARTGMAFAQHFNARAQEKGLIPQKVHFWESDYSLKAFGVDMTHNAITTSVPIGDFFHANPRLFLGHLLSNLADPKTCFFVLAATVVLLMPWLRHDARGLRPASLYLAVMLLGTLIEIIVIYPRDHYAMIALPALLIFLLQLLPEDIRQPPLWLPLGIAAVLILFFHRHKYPSGARVYFRQAECIRQFDMAAPAENTAAFDSGGMLAMFLSGRRKPLVPSDLTHWKAFQLWAESAHPAWIGEDRSLPAKYGVSDAEFDAFVHGKLGYTAHACQAQAYLTIYTP